MLLPLRLPTLWDRTKETQAASQMISLRMKTYKSRAALKPTRKISRLSLPCHILCRCWVQPCGNDIQPHMYKTHSDKKRLNLLETR